jgi:hypothetical protein
VRRFQIKLLVRPYSLQEREQKVMWVLEGRICKNREPHNPTSQYLKDFQTIQFKVVLALVQG